MIILYALVLGFTLGLLVAELLDMVHGADPDMCRTCGRDWEAHADEAVDVARPLGPEDSTDWGAR